MQNEARFPLHLLHGYRRVRASEIENYRQVSRCGIVDIGAQRQGQAADQTNATRYAKHSRSGRKPSWLRAYYMWNSYWKPPPQVGNLRHGRIKRRSAPPTEFGGAGSPDR